MQPQLGNTDLDQFFLLGLYVILRYGKSTLFLESLCDSEVVLHARHLWFIGLAMKTDRIVLCLYFIVSMC